MTNLSDSEICHQAAADVRRLPTVTTGTLMDSITRWCRDDPGRVRQLVGRIVASANDGQPDAGVAFDAVVTEGPAALAYLMDRYGAELDRAAAAEPYDYGTGDAPRS